MSGAIADRVPDPYDLDGKPDRGQTSINATRLIIWAYVWNTT